MGVEPAVTRTQSVTGNIMISVAHRCKQLNLLYMFRHRTLAKVSQNRSIHFLLLARTQNPVIVVHIHDFTSLSPSLVPPLSQKP